MRDLKIVIWCGNAPNQKALANKIAERFHVTGIVVDHGKGASKKKQGLLDMPGKLLDRLRFKVIYDAWTSLMNFYSERYRDWPIDNVLHVESINDPAASSFSIKASPDLVVVSGTGLVKKPLLDVPATIGIINLHTGISPFVKGGPNCTNWCIANNSWNLVGNTIMWLNAGIDAGNILATETTDIRQASSLAQAHQLVMEHAHDLYLRSINYLAHAQPPYQSVPQKELGIGHLYLTKMWTAEKKYDLVRNWKNRNAGAPLDPPQTIALPDIHE